MLLPIATTIHFKDFVLFSPTKLEWAEIEGILYVTDGTKTWELREIKPLSPEN